MRAAALDAAGMTIASHTWDHHPVTRYGEKDWATLLLTKRRFLVPSSWDAHTLLTRLTTS